MNDKVRKSLNIRIQTQKFRDNILAMIHRQRRLEQITHGLRQFPVLALLGPRQVGKTSLARQLTEEWSGPVHHFDLKNPDDQARLRDPAFV
jgi:hypothetical protein